MNISSSDDDPFALTKSSNDGSKILSNANNRVERPLITKTYFYVQGAGNSPSIYYLYKNFLLFLYFLYFHLIK